MKWAIIENDFVATISYAPDRDEEGEILAIWQNVPDDVYAGFVRQNDGGFVPPSDEGQADPVSSRHEERSPGLAVRPRLGVHLACGILA